SGMPMPLPLCGSAGAAGGRRRSPPMDDCWRPRTGLTCCSTMSPLLRHGQLVCLLVSSPSFGKTWQRSRGTGGGKRGGGWRPLTGEELRLIRAVALLEQIGNAASVELLRRLASGAPEALLTVEARQALARIAPAAKGPRAVYP